MSVPARFRILGVSAIAASALVIAGCGSSATTSPRADAATTRIGDAAVSRAADVSGAAKGEKVSYTLSETLPNVGAITVTGLGAFDNAPAQGDLSMHVSVPNAASLGAMASQILSNLQLNLVFQGHSIYLQLPSSLSSLAASFTGGKPWLSVDLSQLASGSHASGLSSLLHSQAGAIDPAQLIRYLEDASAGGVTRTGAPNIDGVATTQYSGSLDLDKLSGELPAPMRTALRHQFARAPRQVDATTIPFTVDIDADNLVRRLSLNFGQPTTTGSPVSAAMTINFLSYGEQPAPTVPAPSETDNLDGLLSSWHKRAAAGSGSSGSFFGS